MALWECCGGGAPQELPGPPDGSQPQLKVKVILLGDWGTGKTSLLERFTENAHPEDPRALQLQIKAADVKVGRNTVRLILWDTGGQEKFRCLTTSYYRDAKAVILIYDITNRETFENIQHWKQQVTVYAPTIDIFLLIGNKVDASADQRQVSAEEGQALAESMRAQFAETSSKEGTNTGVCLAWVAAKCFTKFGPSTS